MHSDIYSFTCTRGINACVTYTHSHARTHAQDGLEVICGLGVSVVFILRTYMTRDQQDEYDALDVIDFGAAGFFSIRYLSFL